MNERVAQLGTQFKDALDKVKNAWTELEATRKKIIIAIAAGLLVLVVGLVVFLNLRASRYVVVYEGLNQEESIEGSAVLAQVEPPIPSRLNAEGGLEVPENQVEQAMAQLALQGIPAITPDYNILAEASGLTTTEFEKRQALTNQWQNRLQDTIKTLNGVQNAIVTLQLPENSNTVWNVESTNGSGSATVHMKPGYVLSQEQANAIRLLIGPSVGIDPKDVTVMDGNMNVLAAAGEDYDINQAVGTEFLERMNIEQEIEARLSEKAANLLSLAYPDSTQWRISATAVLDYDEVLEEIKTYIPLEGTIHGVVDEEQLDAQMGVGQYAEGVVGETDNTDVPVYVDIDGDGELDTVDYHQFRDYAVSYSLEQIERNGPVMEQATISVVINDSLSNEAQQDLRQAIAQGTGLPVENVGVESFLPPGIDEGEEDAVEEGTIIPGIPNLYTFIALGVLLLLIGVVVLILVLKARKKKKLLEEEMAAAAEEAAEAERIQAEIEERKRQLKNAAVGKEAENIITNEVREFAANNPEITANLLRNWLKEGE